MDLGGEDAPGCPDETPPRSWSAGRNETHEGDFDTYLRTNACKRARHSDPVEVSDTHPESSLVDDSGNGSISDPPYPTVGWMSVEELLGVPVDVVLRQASKEWGTDRGIDCSSVSMDRDRGNTAATISGAVASPPAEYTTGGGGGVGGPVFTRSYTPRHSRPTSAPSQSQAPGSERPRHPNPTTPFLLSRSEAHCFLRVRLLAQELDGLVHESSLALERRWECRGWHDRLLGSEGAALSVPPWLRPLVSTLHTLGEDGPAQTLLRLEPHLNRVTQELRREAECLRQFSEQNWAVAESCFGGVHNNDPRSLDKRRLSDLQDECCHRIEVLLGQQQRNIGHTSDDDDDDNKCLPTTSLEEFCRTHWDFDVAIASTSIEGGVDDAHPGAASLLIAKPETKDNRRPSSPLPPPISPPTTHGFVYPEDATATAATSSAATPPPRGSAPTTAPSPTPQQSQSVVQPSEEKENSQQQLLLQELMDAALSPAAAAPLRALSSVPSSPACRWSTGGGSGSGTESLSTLSKVATATAFQPTAPGRGNTSGWSATGIGIGPASAVGSASLLDPSSQQQSAAAAQVLASLLVGAKQPTRGGGGAASGPSSGDGESPPVGR